MPTQRYSPPKGQTTVGHLWESCNAKPSADRQIISCCVYRFPSNGDCMLVFLCDKPWKRGKESMPESHGSLLAPGSAFLENLAWIPDGTNNQRPFSDTSFSTTVHANNLWPRKLELSKHLSSPYIWKPPLQIEWAWLVLVDERKKKSDNTPLPLRPFIVDASPASFPSASAWMARCISP